MNTVLHNHSNFYPNDAEATPTDMVKAAKAKGYEAIALTDHKVLLGIPEFVSACKEENMKAILGVEGDLVEENDPYVKNGHIILMATNEKGYHQICKAVSLSFLNMSNNKPRMTLEILRKAINEIGNVIVTSACINGFVGQIIMYNNRIKEQMNSLNRKKPKDAQEKIDSYTEKKNLLTSLETDIERIRQENSELSVIAKKAYKSRQKSIQKLTGEARETAMANLEAEMQESENAKVSMAQNAEAIKKLQEQKKAVKKEFDKLDAAIKSMEETDKKIAEVKALLKSETELYEFAKKRAMEVIEIVGRDNFYFEIQYHGLDLEKECYPVIVRLARELDIPLVAANDNHIAYNTKNNIKRKQLINSLFFENPKYMHKDATFGEYYIKDKTELAAKLKELYTADVVQEALHNADIIGERCNCELSKITHYPSVPDAEKKFYTAIEEGIQRLFPTGMSEEYKSRLKYETEIITKMGFASYFVIVQDIINRGKRLGKEKWHGVGVGIGPGRGSVVGSLTAFCMGITERIDPIEYNLFFERFLNPDRVSMPDIDIDISNSIRDELIKEVAGEYGWDNVCMIVTLQTRKGRKAVQDAARIFAAREIEKNPEQHEQIKATYDSIAKEISSKIDDSIPFSEQADSIAASFWEDNTKLEVLVGANRMENTIFGYGTHAAGVVISNTPLIEHLPLMRSDSTEYWISQLQKEEVEKQGYLKMDFLGLKTLDIISYCNYLILKETGTCIDVSTLPFESKIFDEIFAKAKTNAIFQCASDSFKRALRMIKPKNIRDVILTNALNRPGPMKYIPDVAAVKNGHKTPEYFCEAQKEILSETYGYPVYQEQIMNLFQKMAGYNIAQADMVRRAMSKKHTEDIERERNAFLYGDTERNIRGCQNNGIDVEKANLFFDELVEFAKYAFNKSHSAVYAWVGYIQAYQKLHYPKEFYTAVLAYDDSIDPSVILADIKKDNLVCSNPDINLSGCKADVVNGEILLGFDNILNIGSAGVDIVAEREENGPFTSYKDFVIRMNVNKQVHEALIYSGAFDSLGIEREKLIDSVSELLEYKSSYKDKSEKGKDSAEKYLGLIQSYLFEKEAAFDRLVMEKKYLRAFISDSPLSNYPSAEELKCQSIDTALNAENNAKMRVFGMLQSLKETVTKKNREKMALGTISDGENDIKVVIFPKQYAKLDLSEGNAYIVRGDIRYNESSEQAELFVSDMEHIRPKERSVIIRAMDITEWCDKIARQVYAYEDAENGVPFLVYDEAMAEFRRGNFLVSRSILKEKTLRVCQENE